MFLGILSGGHCIAVNYKNGKQISSQTRQRKIASDSKRVLKITQNYILRLYERTTKTIKLRKSCRPNTKVLYVWQLFFDILQVKTR